VGCFYIYAFDGRLLAEYDVYGNCLKDYIYMGSRLVAEYDPATSQYYYYTQDQIGSTRIVTDDAGAVVYAAAHDPYGGIQETWANAFDPKRKFSDKERDEETGLDYFGARYYANASYRWVSVDPVLTERALNDPQEWNLYSYCKNNPLAFRDPDGKVAFPGNVALLITPSMLKLFNQALSNFLAGYISTMRAIETLLCGDYGYERWIDTPYDKVGPKSSIGVSGDCSGIPYHAFRGCGYPYVYKRANADFVNSTMMGGANFGILSAIPEDWAPQRGDLGYWDGHFCVYACKINGVDYVYNASYTAGRFQIQKLQPISDSFGGPPVWYRPHRIN
jgi:RHS repeat-associated protein